MIVSKNIDQVLSLVRAKVKTLKTPIVTMMAKTGSQPFAILIATVLSLRTKDETTTSAFERLFKTANTPQKMLQLSEKQIQTLIYPVGFYRRKAKHIKKICEIIDGTYNNQVPSSFDELLRLPGVGRKTANLVLAKGYNIPAICVDTHVHRISNRWGYVKTKTPQQTEMVLRKKLSKKYWIKYNDLLVAYGQSICLPVSPWCSKCVISEYCPKIAMKKFR